MNAGALCALFAVAAGPASAASPVTIDVVSGRADLVSGGQALVAINVPPGRRAADLTIWLGAVTVTPQFATRANGRFEGLLTGIPNGPVTLKATFADGSGASVQLVGHPQGGPVISGPQLTPWICQAGARDAQCNADPTYAFYASVGGSLQKITDPAHPPAGTPTTTTDQGETVPFVVRVETGYQDRDQYKIATLFDPATPWEPWAPQKQFNGKLVFTHGGSCGTDRKTGDAPDVLNAEVLGKGYIVASTALNNLGHNCNPVIITESEIMAREHIVKAYGPIRRTIGTGCSGGSIAQIMAAHAYPGFYDGITTQCTFADLLTTGKQGVAGHLLLNYLQKNPGFALDYGPVSGSPLAVTDDKGFDTAFYSNITGASGCMGLDPSTRYSEANPKGVRCGVLDHNVNIFGRAANGFAGVPLGDVGVQFGLGALRSGTITPARFADLNAKIGGIDKTTYADVPSRTEADRAALTNAYRSGYEAIGNTLGETPFIEGRGPNETTVHVTYPTLAINARLDRQFGTHASHAVWQGPTPLLGSVAFINREIFAMDRWIAAIQGDTSSRSTAAKVVADRPADITDHCEDATGAIQTPGLDCPAINRFYQSPTNVAGESIRGDILACQLKPLDRSSYASVTFTDAQWAQLQAAFPTGVCDYTKPGIGETQTVPWLTYADTPGGRPLGSVPRSAAIPSPGPASPSAPSHARRRSRARRSVLTLLGVRAAVARLRPARRTRVTVLKAKGTAPARRVRIDVRDARGHVIARSRLVTISRVRTAVTITRSRRLHHGVLRVRVRGLDAVGRLPVRVVRVRL